MKTVHVQCIMIRNKDNAHLFKYQTNKGVRTQIDKCLHSISALHAQMIGIDSTQEERQQFIDLSKPYKERIKQLDEAYYKELMYDK